MATKRKTNRKTIERGVRATERASETLLDAARRERVAIACMQGLLTAIGPPDLENPFEPEWAARWAVEYADALLDELDGFADEDEDDEDEDDER
jgi:hypothetical protein